MEAVRTNIIGTDNVLRVAIEAKVKKIVCLSTDKAAYPINVMGMSKTMMEHFIRANARVSIENCDLNYDKYFVQGTVETKADEAYTSHNTKLLDVDGVIEKILTTDYVREKLARLSQ